MISSHTSEKILHRFINSARIVNTLIFSAKIPICSEHSGITTKTAVQWRTVVYSSAN